MQRTYAIADMNMLDVTALEDGAESTNGVQDFSNLNFFKTKTEQPRYATLEHNFFVLDGSCNPMPNSVIDVCYWSSAKSNINGTFAVNPTITVEFTENHTSAGLTFTFVEDYPAEMKITWYGLDGSKKSEKTFYPDALFYVARYQQKNYGKVVIEFVKTTHPNRYIKLQYIDYGIYLSWNDDMIIKAEVVEEVSTTSEELSINTASVIILDEKNDFDIANAEGAWNSVQRMQKVTLSEYVNGEIHPAGVYFIDQYSFRKNRASFELIDAVGKLDNYVFDQGEVYEDASAQDILRAIFSAAGVYNYDTSNGENKLRYPYYQTTRTANGLTFTDLGDGRVKVNGTATARTDFVCENRLHSDYRLPKGDFTLSGCPAGGSSTTYMMWVNRTVNGSAVLYGRDTGNGYDFTVTDDTTPHGIVIRIENGTTVNDLIFEPMLTYKGVSHEEYIPYDGFVGTTLTGHLPIMSCREALQRVCFALGAVCDDSRTERIYIYKPSRYVQHEVGTDRKFNGNTAVALDEYVSGVSIECSRYSLADQSNNIYDDILPAGRSRIEYSTPYKVSTISATAGTIIEAKTNYLVIEMATAGQCTITGTPYDASTFTIINTVDRIEAGEIKNVKEYKGITLFNSEKLPELAESILNYYSLRKTVDMKYLLDAEKSGEWVNIKDRAGILSTTLIESQKVDLSGGFIAVATCRGYNKVLTDWQYTGEIKTNQGGLL